MIFIDALKCRNKGRAPVWLMRQAGRYMPSYRALKQKHTPYELFHQSELIYKITKMPLEHLGVDAAILFADILNLLDGMHVEWDFDEKSSPVISADIQNIKRKDPEKSYQHITQAITALKKDIFLPLIGFAGGPFTVACYLIEERKYHDFRKIRGLLYNDPLKMHKLLTTITEATIDYLHLQIAAGVDAIHLFDSWAGVLSPQELHTFSLPYLHKILTALPKIPTIVFCRGSSLFAPELARLPLSAISLDWHGDIKQIRAQVPKTIALQGNLDPALLYSTPDIIKEHVDKMLDDMAGEPGYIFNLGHGVYPETPIENVQFLVNYVKNRALAIR